MRRRPRFGAEITFAAQEVDLGAVGREAGIDFVGRVERDLLFLAATARDQVDVAARETSGLEYAINLPSGDQTGLPIGP